MPMEECAWGRGTCMDFVSPGGRGGGGGVSRSPPPLPNDNSSGFPATTRTFRQAGSGLLGMREQQDTPPGGSGGTHEGPTQRGGGGLHLN